MIQAALLFVLGLTGSLVGSLVNIIIPSVLFIALTDNNKEHYTVPYAKICLVAGCFILLVSTWATLQVDRTTDVVEKPMPKDGAIDKPALRNLQKLEEKVLDANLNISAKLDNIAGLAAIGKDREAASLLAEMKQQRKEQKDLIKKQEKIVQELSKYAEMHDKGKRKAAVGICLKLSHEYILNMGARVAQS
uniref:Aa_trans domain-containing protein n=1 Tax=Angiostrongylus cantonensis TaxID=6313 RepID=A0A0K0CUZ6_ANGCA